MNITRCRFGLAYSEKVEYEHMQVQEAIRTGNAGGMLVFDDRYGADIVPMFTDTKLIPEYAKKMAKCDNRFGREDELRELREDARTLVDASGEVNGPLGPVAQLVVVPGPSTGL